MAETRLTTTSYAVLGLLAMQPWTMYALAQEMRRNIRYFYPRAESRLYEEPKRLEQLGFVTAERSKTGRRVTTTYAITPGGLAELRRWLSRPVAKGPVLEFEGLLRVFLAPFGTEDDMRATLAQVRSEIAELADLAARIAGEYQAGQAPFQRFAPTRVMVHDFLSSFAELVDAWAERSLRSIDTWEGNDDAWREADAIAAFRRNSRMRADGIEGPVAAPSIRPSTARRKKR